MATGTIDRAAGIPASEEADRKFEYPGIPTTCDGAEAVVWVETRISQGSGAYPITSSTTMGGGFNASVMNGQKGARSWLSVISTSYRVVSAAC